MEEWGLIFENTFLLRQKIYREKIDIFYRRCRGKRMSYEWKGEKNEERRLIFSLLAFQGVLLLHLPANDFQTPHTIFFSFLAWYIDISVVRWLGKCSRNTVEVSSIYFFLVRGLKKGSYTRCPRIFLPHNVVNDESGEIGWGWRKGQSYINNSHIFLASSSFICIFLSIYFPIFLQILVEKEI